MRSLDGLVLFTRCNVYVYNNQTIIMKNHFNHLEINQILDFGRFAVQKKCPKNGLSGIFCNDLCGTQTANADSLGEIVEMRSHMFD